MSTAIVTLPGLEPHHAKDLVNMALQEWRSARDTPHYVGSRYDGLTEEFRDRRSARLLKELAALNQIAIDTRETP